MEIARTYHTVLFVGRRGLQALDIGVNPLLLLGHGRNGKSGKNGVHYA